MKRILVLAAVLCLVAWADLRAAEGFASEDAAMAYAKKVTEDFSKEDFDAVFDAVSSQWLFNPAEIDALKGQTIKQLPIIQGRYGKPVGIEFMKTEKGGKSLLRINYLIKHERLALRVIFTFYKPNDKWLLIGFSWNDKIDELLE